MTITGKLGEVMQESAQAALSYVRSRAKQLGLDPDFHQNLDIHVHVPEGAIPKDGPSAGITMATSIVSALSRIPVRSDVAMTGEITLRGRVLPIGGLKEKILAAHRALIKTVLIPKENAKDLKEIPAKILEEINIELLTHMDDVLRLALAPEEARELFKEPEAAAPVILPKEPCRRRDSRALTRVCLCICAPGEEVKPPDRLNRACGDPAAGSPDAGRAITEQNRLTFSVNLIDNRRSWDEGA